MRIYFTLEYVEASPFAAIRRAEGILGHRIDNEGHTDEGLLLAYIEVDRVRDSGLIEVISRPRAGAVALGREAYATGFRVVRNPGLDYPVPLTEPQCKDDGVHCWRAEPSLRKHFGGVRLTETCRICNLERTHDTRKDYLEYRRPA